MRTFSLAPIQKITFGFKSENFYNVAEEMLRTKVRHKYSFEDDRKLCKYYYDAVKARRASAVQPKGLKLWQEAHRDGLFSHLTVDAMQTRFVNF